MKSLKAFAFGLALAGASAFAVGAADARTCHTSRHNEHVGTAVGAVGGGLLGNAVTHGGGRLGGTIIGAVAGGAIGHQVGKHSVKCEHGYYYDRYHHRHYY
jgi:uncharacterized protein YcfJ